MIVGCVKGNIFDLDSDNDDDSTNDVPHTPTMTEILEKAKQHHNIELHSKQLKAYEMICATFMIKLIQDQISGTSSEHDNTEQAARINCIIEGLKSLGGKDQLIMFLMGPAGAGKTTSIKLTQTFCEKFSLACSIPFDQYSFYFTAYMGAAASEYGGITTLSALQIKPMSNDITEASESTRSTLNNVKILIMDKISFMSVKDLQLISKRLQELFECATPFGGMSIIFSGDFRQLEQR
jgi:predicted ATPase